MLTGILLQKELVWRARDGLEALDLMKTHRFDVVSMDIHMPGLDGYKAIRGMRDWETNRQCQDTDRRSVVRRSAYANAFGIPSRLLRLSAQAARPT